MIFKKVGIIGLGVIGIGIAKALKSRDNNVYIAGNNRNKNLSDLLLAKKIIDNLISIDEIFKTCDLIILATPVDTIKKVLRENKNLIKKDSILIDVGSTKEFATEFENIQNFIPCHPIFGNLPIDYQNLENSISKIGNNEILDKEIYITKTSFNSSDDHEKVEAFWKFLGGKIIKSFSIYEHDEFFSLVSHFPHFLGFTIIDILDEGFKFNQKDFEFTGFFRTSSKIVNYKMWIPIFLENKNNLENDINSFLIELNNLSHGQSKSSLDLLISNSILNLLQKRNINSEKYKNYSVFSLINHENSRINLEKISDLIKKIQEHSTLILQGDFDEISKYYDKLNHQFSLLLLNK